jgi:hypothetical protein
METKYLLRTSANREHLARSQADVLAGRLFEYELPITKASEGKRIVRPAKKITPTKKSPRAKGLAAVKAVKAAKGTRKKTSA